jgi:hypothetical protein
VRRDDRAGLVQQQARRPQVVGQVVSGGLQQGRQAAVEDDDTIAHGVRQVGLLGAARGPHGSILATRVGRLDPGGAG